LKLTPAEVTASGGAPLPLLLREFKLNREGLPWRDGLVSFVRLTDERDSVRFFSEGFGVDPMVFHENITGTIYTKPGLLKFTHQERTVKTYRQAVTRRDL